MWASSPMHENAPSLTGTRRWPRGTTPVGRPLTGLALSRADPSASTEPPRRRGDRSGGSSGRMFEGSGRRACTVPGSLGPEILLLVPVVALFSKLYLSPCGASGLRPGTPYTDCCRPPRLLASLGFRH